MGVPVGQDARGDILASTAMGGHSHITNPFSGTGASNDAMQAVFPNSTSFLSTTQAYPGAIPDLSSSSAMQSFGIGAPQASMQAQDEYYSSRPAAPSHIRTRSFTADSHTLANLGQVPPTRECNNSLAPPDTSMAPSPTGISQHGLMNHSNNVSSIFGSPDGVPTAEALLESRRRHLNDLIIINQTQAVRGIRTSDVPQSTHISVPSSAVEPDSSNKPLLFSNLSSVDTQIIDTIAASASGSVASGQPVAGFIASIGGNNIDLGMPSTHALDYRNQQAVRPSSDDTSEAIITSMPAPPQPLAGCTADSDMSALFELGKGTLGDDHSSTAKEPHAKAFGAADLPNGLEHSLANGDSNYQFLNSLLLDCNTLDLLGGPNGSGQEQSGVSGASERSPHLAVGSSVLDVALSQRSLADALLVNRQFAGSSSREGSIAPDIAFSRELSANCPQQSSRSSSLSDSSISMSNATVDVESFLLASTSNTTSPPYSAQNMAEAVAFLHTSASEASPLQPKRSPSNQVSVARSGVPGQRDLMIEQLSYSTMPL
ncbi:hypothetical protein GGI23_004736 [Coemansia sp. RSA 2559]|nr:hypothetical protein GGI23_004736 [Coemansia sp. RSA 2559]